MKNGGDRQNNRNTNGGDKQNDRNTMTSECTQEIYSTRRFAEVRFDSMRNAAKKGEHLKSARNSKDRG